MNKREYNKLYKLIFNNFNEDSKISSYEELIGYLKEMRTFKPENNKKMKLEKAKTELYALSSGLLALALQSSQDKIKKEFRQYSTVYYTLLTNISNSCLAIIKLLENGFEFQSQVIVRNLIELVYTLLVVIINKTKCKQYFDSARLQNEYDVWNKSFRMSKLNEELYTFEKQDDNEYAEMMKEARKRIYGEYSSYAHNDFICCFVGCHSSQEESDIINYNLWGTYNYKSNNILSFVNDLLWMMFLYFKSIMSRKNIFDKSDFIINDNYKDWNNALFITVLLDKEKRKEVKKDTTIN